MKIKLNRKGPLGIKEQIRRMIRARIDSGQLEPGRALPSAKDLAMLLDVNRNTVAQAYKDLEAEGVLKVIKGSGAYVDRVENKEVIRELDRIFDEALNKAEDLGVDIERAVDHWLDRILAAGADVSTNKILVVECNHEVIDDLSQRLEQSLGVKTEGVLIQTLEQAGDRAAAYLEGVDLVVCGFNHVEDFNKVFPVCPLDLVAVMLKPNIRIMNELLKLPAGSRVGYTCANQRSTETLFQSLPFSGGSSLIKVRVGLDDPKGLEQMTADCEVIFATHYVYDRVKVLAGDKARVVKVDLGIEESNIDLVRERLFLSGKGSK